MTLNLDTLLDQASDLNFRVTWGKRFQGRHWVQAEFPDGTTRTGTGETRDDAARQLLIVLLDLEAVTA